MEFNRYSLIVVKRPKFGGLNVITILPVVVMPLDFYPSVEGLVKRRFSGAVRASDDHKARSLGNVLYGEVRKPLKPLQFLPT